MLKSHGTGHRNPYEAIVISVFIKYIARNLREPTGTPHVKKVIVSAIETHTKQYLLLCA